MCSNAEPTQNVATRKGDSELVKLDERPGWIYVLGVAGCGKSWIANRLCSATLGETFHESLGVSSESTFKFLPAFRSGWTVCEAPPLLDVPQNNCDAITQALSLAVNLPAKFLFVALTRGGRLVIDDIITIHSILDSLPKGIPFTIIVNQVDQAAEFQSQFEIQLRGWFPNNQPEYVEFVPRASQVSEVKTIEEKLQTLVCRMTSTTIKSVLPVLVRNFDDYLVIARQRYEPAAKLAAAESKKSTGFWSWFGY